MNGFLLKALDKDAAKNYAVLVKGNVAYVKQFTDSHHGLFKYNCGDISSVILTGNDLKLLAQSKVISRIEFYEKIPRPLDDSSIVKNNILKIHNGQTPLPQAYNGAGVTFGLVDTGIDFKHPDFKDSATGKTRIKWIWDQALTTGGVKPMPYGYGQEWNNVQIDSGHCTHVDINDIGHGTKVSGIAVGNGNTNAIYKGHAPKADIICVALDYNGTGPLVLDGINYLATKANTLGQPFVLNLSIGDYYGSHDGKDLQAQAIDALFANIPGRSIVAAAGNAGNAPFHLEYTLSADTNFTFIRNKSNPQSQFLLYADTNNFKQAHYTIGVYDSTNLRYKGNIGFRTISSCLGITITDTLKNSNGKRLGYVQTAANIQGNTYELLINIVADTLGYFWTLENTGTGTFDTWNFDFLYKPLPTVGTLPRMTYYKLPDTLQTICTSFQCSNQVITVANYTERRGHISCKHTFYPMPGPYDTLLYYCSRGPTRDLRTKPDISATGDNIVTTGTLYWSHYLAVNFPATNQIIAEDTMHMTFSGTSSAAPSVAGFVALYLQKNPTATNIQIKNAITGCAKRDYFTGNSLPNNSWGYGKLDGYSAMLCGSSVVKNYNYEELTVFPNPTTGQIQFNFTNEPGAFDIKLYSVLGAEVKTIHADQKNLPVFVGNLPQGLYLYKILRNATLIGEGKFIKE
ncbi:MAG TPA: S8 family peptidase [Bacteroidia bacterium]|nr:S8 family peptidase [Bacteroidia bacterium]